MIACICGGTVEIIVIGLAGLIAAAVGVMPGRKT